MENITSRSNNKIKHVSLLVADSSLRKREGLFVVEGARLTQDVFLSGAKILELYATRSALEKYGEMLDAVLLSAGACYLITDEIALKISDTKAPQGVFCVACPLDKTADDCKIIANNRYVAAENIQNPANLGAIARTAEALGLDGIVVSGGCDVYNPKALRASMGSLLRLNIFIYPDIITFLTECRAIGLKSYAAVTVGGDDVRKIDFSAGAVCVIGNEGSGLNRETINACSDKISIPMNGRAESLNASAAACILMWEMLRNA